MLYYKNYIASTKPARLVYLNNGAPEVIKVAAAPKNEKPKAIDSAAQKAEAVQLAAAENLDKKTDVKRQRTLRLTEALCKDPAKLNTLELHTLTVDSTGRDSLRATFLQEQPDAVVDGKTANKPKNSDLDNKVLKVDFGKNGKAESKIGAGDMLPSNVSSIMVTTAEGKVMSGVRAPSPEYPDAPRPGYYRQVGNPESYIPIFSGDQIKVVSTLSEAEMTQMNAAMQKVSGGKDLNAVETELWQQNVDEAEHGVEVANQALQAAGVNVDSLDSLNGESREKIKNTFQAMSGSEVWQVRQAIGPKQLGEIFKNAGLTDERVDLDNLIANSPSLKKVTDQLPPEMVRKIMTIESRGSTFAVSPTGALGAMQLTKWIYHDIPPPINPFDPAQAAQRSAEHLLDTYNKSGRNEEVTVRTYNGGPKYASNQGADRAYYEKYQKA